MSDLDEKLTSILSSIVEDETIDGHHPLLSSATGLSLPSLSGSQADDESARLKDIENITKSLERAEVQLKQSQLQRRVAANNGCEALVPSLSAPLLPNVLDVSEAIAVLIEPGRIGDIERVLDASVAVESIASGLDAEKPHNEPCAIVNEEGIGAECGGGTLGNGGNDDRDPDADVTRNDDYDTDLPADQCDDENAAAILSTTECGQIAENLESSGAQENCDREDGAAHEEEAETIISDVIPRANRRNRPRRAKRRRIVVCEDSDSDSSRSDDGFNKSPASIRRDGDADHKASADLASKDRLHSAAWLNQEHPSDMENEYVSLTEPSSSEHESATEHDPNDIVIPNERPGPKSRKQSTLLSAALKAKALLESAVVIPAKHRKKKRIIDSDDEATAHPTTSVDDIGRIGDDNTHIPPGIAFEREDDNSPAPRKFESRIDRGIGSSEPFLIKMMKAEPGEQRRRRPPLNRMTTRIQFEQSDDFDETKEGQRRAAKKAVDIFETSLNAGYVDTSSDDDYFPNEPRFGHASTSGSFRGRPHLAASQPQTQPSTIPNDVYFNSTVPLNVLLSYDKSSSEDDGSHSPPETISQALARMPPVYRIPAYDKSRDKLSKRNKVTAPKYEQKPIQKVAATHPPKPAICSQLEHLKSCLKASGIKIILNDLLKGCKSYQERCDRITAQLNENGIDGEPTVAKCKQLRLELKLKEEVAALDPSAIIEAIGGDGRPIRVTRTAIKRASVRGDDDRRLKVAVVVDNEAAAAVSVDRVRPVVGGDANGENGQFETHGQQATGSSEAELMEDVDAVGGLPTEKQNVTEAIVAEAMEPGIVGIELLPAVSPSCQETEQLAEGPA